MATVTILRPPVQKFKFRFKTEHNTYIKGEPSVGKKEGEKNESGKNKHKKNDNNKEKCYPEIQITGCKGPGEVWVQCVYAAKPVSHPNLLIRSIEKHVQPDHFSGKYCNGG